MPTLNPRTASRGASSNGLSRCRRLSDTRTWTPEPTDVENDEEKEEEEPDIRRNRIYLWLSTFLLQLFIASSCIATVFLVQDFRGTGPGPEPFHIIWFVLSLSLTIATASITYTVLRRRRQLRQLATQSIIIRLNADVDELAQQNIELRILNRRSQDHGSISSRRASPLGEEDFASYHRYRERGMDVGVRLWADYVASFVGKFVDIRGSSWDGSSAGTRRTATDGNAVPVSKQ
ncbi:MAG: hypothetical protein M1840_006517 [Geoglossum simile]|nr:MAG: hypothetical protein M1840_006517 [Geoglossum simile]